MELLDRLQRFRLDRDVEGRPVNQTAFFNAAVLDLPAAAEEVLGLFARHAGDLNVGRRAADDGFLPEGRLALRISPEAERHLALIIRDLYDRTGRRYDRQDLWGLALLRALP